MSKAPIDAIPLWLVFAGTCVVSGFAMEVGYRLGKWRRQRTADEKETPVGAMVGSILALFAFMLAFTFGMAGSRFENRRSVILQEANSIGTTSLRARFLHEPQRTASVKLLQEYVGLRIRSPENMGTLESALRRSEEIHGLLWTEAMKEVASHPTPITALYIASLNELIDVHSERVQIGIRNRIPTEIWCVLFALGILGMSSVGYQAGLSITRRSPAMTGLILAFAIVFQLIADLERPQEGFLSVNQDALIQVRDSMQKENP